MIGRGRGHTTAGRTATRSLAPVALAFALAAAWSAAALAEGPEADPPPWTAGVGRVTLASQTVQEAYDQARNLALKDAIEKATDSFLIRASDDYVRQEAGDSHFERFSKAIRREISGRIVEIRNTDYASEEPAPDLLQVVCRLEARVAVEKQERNSAFAVRVDLRGNEAGIYRMGEEMFLEIRASLDCWVTGFNVYADGTVAVLLPNARMPDNRVKAGEVFVLPDHEDPAQRLVHFRLGVPEDQPRTDEYIAVVATLREHSFLSNTTTDYGPGYIPTYEAAIGELNRWILEIPAAERAEAEVYYSIFR